MQLGAIPVSVLRPPPYNLDFVLILLPRILDCDPMTEIKSYSEPRAHVGNPHQESRGSLPLHQVPQGPPEQKNQAEPRVHIPANGVFYPRPARAP